MNSSQWYLNWLTAAWHHFSFLTWQMWKDKSKRFTTKHHLFYTHAHARTHTQLSDALTKTVCSVEIKARATAWKWNCTSSADLKLHIKHIHSKTGSPCIAKQWPRYPWKPPVTPNLYAQSIITNTGKSLCVFFTSQCLVCCEDSWYQPFLLVLNVPCRSIVQHRISAAGVDLRTEGKDFVVHSLLLKNKIAESLSVLMR